MAFGFKAVDREQGFLLPPDVREWLPQGHLAWFVLEVVEQLDLSGFEAAYRLGRQGRAAYHPAMMVGLVLYGFAVGVVSARGIARACETDVAFRVIAANERPDHATLARFRRRHEEALRGLFTQVLALGVSAGMVDARQLAVDSTKLQANAAMGSNVTREELAAHARRVLAEAAQADADDDACYGSDQRGDEPAEGWQDPAWWPEQIRQALGELDGQSDGREEIEARQQARQAAGRPRRGRPALPADPAKPGRVASQQHKQAKKVNLTDPTSRALKAPQGWVQGYTAQAVVAAGQVIVAAEVTNDQNDNTALEPMLAAARANLAGAGTDQRPRTVLADSGYWNSEAITRLERADASLRLLVAPISGKRLRTDPDADAAHPSKRVMLARLRHPPNRRRYQQRAPMVEPVFGHHKHNRGLVGFLRRGLEAVRTDWRLHATAFNVTKMWAATA